MRENGSRRRSLADEQGRARLTRIAAVLEALTRAVRSGADIAAAVTAIALLEALKGVRTEVVDPELGFFVPQQPDERMLAFHIELIEEMRVAAGL